MPVSAADIATPAPLAALAFLATGLLLGLTLVAAVVAIWRRAPRWGLWLLSAAGALTLGYAGVLGLTSLRSGDRVLPRGGAKYFCELDCHLAYSVAAVGGLDEGPGVGELVVHLAVRFDPETVSPRRGDAPLTPNPRIVEVVDAAGRRYGLSRAATIRYREVHGASASLETPLRPGESVIVPLVFEVPSGIQKPMLWISGGDWINRLLIGHEQSPGHGKVYLALDGHGHRASAVGRRSSVVMGSGYPQ